MFEENDEIGSWNAGGDSSLLNDWEVHHSLLEISSNNASRTATTNTESDNQLSCQYYLNRRAEAKKPIREK